MKENKTKDIKNLINEAKEELANNPPIPKSIEDEIKKLREENKNLKLLVKELEERQKTKKIELTDEEIICKMEIQKLREISLIRALTMEEAKKLDIFSKLLMAFENKPKTLIVDTSKFSDKELLSLLDSDILEDQNNNE